MTSDFDEYQVKAVSTAIYPQHLRGIYPVLGLCGETGEVAEIVKKLQRDKAGTHDEEDRKKLMLELGDVLWYLANVAFDYNISLHDIANENLAKLADRKTRGALQGSGDNR